MMKNLNLLLLSLLFCLPLFAQRDLSGGKLLAEIEKNGWDKEEMLSFYEKYFKAIAQSELPGFTVTSVKIDRRTGEVTVLGKNAGGTTETLNGAEIKRRSIDPNSGGGGEPDAIFEWLKCLFRKLTLRSCPSRASAPVPPSGLTPEEIEMRRRTQSMMYD